MSLEIGVRNYNELSTNAISFGSPEINTHLRNLHCAPCRATATRSTGAARNDNTERKHHD